MHNMEVYTNVGDCLNKGRRQRSRTWISLQEFSMINSEISLNHGEPEICKKAGNTTYLDSRYTIQKVGFIGTIFFVHFFIEFNEPLWIFKRKLGIWRIYTYKIDTIEN